MGCPVRKVVNRRAGAALLTDLPRLCGRSCARMAAASTLPVTAKIRLGWDGASSQRGRGGARARGRGGAGAWRSTPAPAPRSSGASRSWELIGEAKRAVGIPVIGNGDVRVPEDAVRMLETTGCDGVMLGRAAFGDPWIFRRVRAFWERGERLPLPTAAERLEAGLRHLRLLVEWAGPDAATREMRKHVAWYVKRAAAQRARARAGEPRSDARTS